MSSANFLHQYNGQEVCWQFDEAHQGKGKEDVVAYVFGESDMAVVHQGHYHPEGKGIGSKVRRWMIGETLMMYPSLYTIALISVSPHDTENKEAKSKEGSLDQVEGRGLVLFILGVASSKLLQKVEGKDEDETLVYCNRKSMNSMNSYCLDFQNLTSTFICR